MDNLLDGLPVVVWEGAIASGALSFVSGAVRELLGYPPASWLSDPALASSMVHPEDREHCARAREEGCARGRYELTYRALAADGRVVWLQELARVAPDGTVRGVWLDAGERRAEAERQRFLAGFERGLQELDDAEQVMEYAARSLGEHLGADRCAYAEAEGDEDHFLMSGDHHTGLPPLPGRFAMSAFGQGCVRAMRAGKSWVVHDCSADARLVPADLNAYRVTGIRAVICVPLLRGGRFVAAMAVHQATVRHWTDAEVDLVELIVSRCWESIQRTHAGRALRDSEQRHRLLVERATDAIWVLDRALRFAEINAAACELLGYRRDELIGTPITGLLDDDGIRRWRQLVAEPGAVRETSEVHHVRRAGGAEVVLELSIQVTPSGVQAIGRDITERRRREAERDLLLQREHEIAETLQRSLLPRELPALARVAAAARYQPAAAHAQTGGDWYELVALGGSVVALSVGDVVGKGPQAAAVMGQLRSALTGSLLDGHGPAAALERLDAFAARTDGAAGTTCACLTLDWETGELRWAVAGHPPPVLVGDGTARLLPGGGSVLGRPDRPGYTEQSTKLVPGASVLLYTDGLIERRDEPIDEGLRRLCDAAARAHASAPDLLVAAITDELLDGGQDDDVAVLAVRLMPPPLQRRAVAEPAVLRHLRDDLSRWSALAGLSAEVHQDLTLAFGEAVANSVEHAFPAGPGEVTYSVTRTADSRLVGVVHDDGRWRPEPADNSHRGRGIGIIKALSDQFAIEHHDDGTAVRFALSPDPAREREARPAAAPDVPAPANVSVDATVPGQLTVRLTGDLDLSTVGQVGPATLAEVRATQSRSVLVDLTEVRYLSSCGIALLLDTAAVSRSRDLELTIRGRAGSAPLRILQLAGLVDPAGSPFTAEVVPETRH
ncbi:SpoIIE family protein phosphatase [Amycolatopsis sp. A133]|uniref:SpoIIE family protein phosphatase n=1 Tax=Amycolatopsis sp. A133 TaxID=3064472 RepID=UPI0027FF6BAA|nr:SpoIIE family protein phosphatase [Amycolatopsis sp. A133]MDQ7810842.1 SpoIIE family protein phosphatase [Amycolatopsis sp. A133]